MGKKKSCTPEERQIIVNLVEKGYFYAQIGDLLTCSRNKVYNAVKYWKKNGTTSNVSRKKRSRKTTPQEDRAIIRASKKDHFLSSKNIQNEVFGASTPKISARTVRRRLNEAGLHGRISRVKPLLRKKHRDKRKEFAKSHLYSTSWDTNDWKRVLFSDESKFNRWGNNFGKIFSQKTYY